MANTNDLENELSLALAEYELPGSIRTSVVNWLTAEKKESEFFSKGVHNPTFANALSEIRPKNRVAGWIVLGLALVSLLIGLIAIIIAFGPPRGHWLTILEIGIFCWTTFVLGISSGLGVLAFFTSRFRKKTRAKITKEFDELAAEVNNDPICFIEQTILYYEAKKFQFRQANSSIESKRIDLLDMPMIAYQKLKETTEGNLANYKNTDPETMPDQEARIREAEEQIRYCEDQISNIEPLKKFVKVRNARIRNKIELITGKIELLQTLKTDLHAVAQIKTAPGLEYLEENYSAMINKRRQEAVQRLCTDLQTLESEVDATAKGITEIVQKVPMVSDAILQRQYVA